MAEFAQYGRTIETEEGSAIKIGLKWDFVVGSEAVDLDAQVVKGVFLSFFLWRYFFFFSFFL